MRVLFIYPRTLDPKNSVGGVEVFLHLMTPFLHSLNVEPIIYSCDKKGTALTMPSQVIKNVPIYSGPFVRPGFFISKRKLVPVLELCQQAKIDVIHAQGTYTAGFMALQIYKHLHIPYVVTSHSDILATNSKRMTRARVRRRCCQVLKHAAFVTHLTPMMAAISHEFLDTKEKSQTIGNGIDCHAWESFLSLPEKNYMLGIGRLERGKGFHILIDMYAKLIERGFSTSLVIAGKGTEEKNLQLQVKKLGLTLVTDVSDLSSIPDRSVVFAGYVRDDVKKRLIAQSQFVLFATQPDLWEEAFGIVQLEAMAAGKPLIASETNVTQFLQKNGLEVSIVKPDDVNAWTDHASLLLNNAEERQRAGKANLNAVTQFDWQPIAQQYRDVYLRVREIALG